MQGYPCAIYKDELCTYVYTYASALQNTYMQASVYSKGIEAPYIRHGQ